MGAVTLKDLTLEVASWACVYQDGATNIQVYAGYGAGLNHCIGVKGFFDVMTAT
jgi:hypothetical protein